MAVTSGIELPVKKVCESCQRPFAQLHIIQLLAGDPSPTGMVATLGFEVCSGCLP